MILHDNLTARQHVLQDIRIVRQGREIDLHNAMMMTHAVASLPMTPA